VAIGNGGIGSVGEITDASANLTKSFKRLSPYFVPKVLVNMAAGHVSIRHGLQGPVHAVATACAAGAHSIGDAYNFIRLGSADAMLAGGTDASIDPLALSGFARMKALGSMGEIGDMGEMGDSESEAMLDERAQRVSRPFHKHRNGFVMGEGAGILVLEELGSAQAREARIIAEVCGYGLSGDAFNATSPSADGGGAVRSMRAALRDAGVSPEQVGYVNAHATSTPVGDAVEVSALRTVFGTGNGSTGNGSRSMSPLYVSSTKGATGHLLGAAGAVETAFTAWALHTGKLPPTLHLGSLDDIDPALLGGDTFTHVLQEVQYAQGGAQAQAEAGGADGAGGGFKYAMKNSFGFGGTNASLVLRKFEV
jgi:3-oxoacyl-[acyl-carrier-protein] synthase II